MNSKLLATLAIASLITIIGLSSMPANALPTPPTPPPPPIPASACAMISNTLTQAGVSASVIAQILTQLGCS